MKLSGHMIDILKNKEIYLIQIFNASVVHINNKNWGMHINHLVNV
jgi:hypothetical protein